jgi:hypothetical protein
VVRLQHLARLTDDTGLLEHARHSLPAYAEGYTTDDNARALLVAGRLAVAGDPAADRLLRRYLAFVAYAHQPATGRFRNELGYDRRWRDEGGGDDCQGRVLMALGYLAAWALEADLAGEARRLLALGLAGWRDGTSPRGWAYALVGLEAARAADPTDPALAATCDRLADRLLQRYSAEATPAWPWFEDRLTYANALLPHALIVAGEDRPAGPHRAAGLAALDWLMAVQRPGGPGGCFAPIGSDGFYLRGGRRAGFDQQPIEAQVTVSACLAAYRATGEARWLEDAWCAYDWFHGRNVVGLPLADPATGGCRDGLHADRVNENQGAESTLAYLQAALELADHPRPAEPSQERPAR